MFMNKQTDHVQLTDQTDPAYSRKKKDRADKYKLKDK